MKCTWTWGGQCEDPVTDLLTMRPGINSEVEWHAYCHKHTKMYKRKDSGWTVLLSAPIVKRDAEAESW